MQRHRAVGQEVKGLEALSGSSDLKKWEKFETLDVFTLPAQNMSYFDTNINKLIQTPTDPFTQFTCMFLFFFLPVSKTLKENKNHSTLIHVS